MKELLKMIWSRIIGKRPNSDYRYFYVQQLDGVEYEIQVNKDYVMSQISYWVNNNIVFKEITEWQYYKGFSKTNILN